MFHSAAYKSSFVASIRPPSLIGCSGFGIYFQPESEQSRSFAPPSPVPDLRHGPPHFGTAIPRPPSGRSRAECKLRHRRTPTCGSDATEAYLDHETWVRPGVRGGTGDLRARCALDYGCGHGMAAVARARAGATVTAFDLSPGYVHEAGAPVRCRERRERRVRDRRCRRTTVRGREFRRGVGHRDPSPPRPRESRIGTEARTEAGRGRGVLRALGRQSAARGPAAARCRIRARTAHRTNTRSRATTCTRSAPYSRPWRSSRVPTLRDGSARVAELSARARRPRRPIDAAPACRSSARSRKLVPICGDCAAAGCKSGLRGSCRVSRSDECTDPNTDPHPRTGCASSRCAGTDARKGAACRWPLRAFLAVLIDCS